MPKKRASSAKKGAAKKPAKKIPEKKKIEVKKAEVKKPEAKKPEIKKAVKKPTQSNLSMEKFVEEVKQKAFEIFLNRGGTPGAEMTDWLEAEKAIKAKYNIK